MEEGNYQKKEISNYAYNGIKHLKNENTSFTSFANAMQQEKDITLKNKSINI